MLTEECVLMQQVFPNRQAAREFEFVMRKNGFETWHCRLDDYDTLEGMIASRVMVYWVEY
jgi:hypothetical protein